MFRRVLTWVDEAVDPFPEIKSLGFRSPRHESEKPPCAGETCGRVRYYNDSRGFAKCDCGTFIHIRDVISGELREGARVVFERKDTAKGPEGVNVRVIG